MSAHALYRFFADDGRLLYVGITNNPGGRFTQHSQDKPWWHEVKGITLQTYPDRESVLAAEARAVKVEQPVYNQKLRRVPTGREAQPSRGRQTKVPELVWNCWECKKPVTGESGYIHIPRDEVRVVEDAWREYRKARDAAFAAEPGRVVWPITTEFLDLPRPVKWRVHHGVCDPNPDDNDYWFYVNRAKTHAHLLSWSGHFMETKRWIEHTDWHSFIRRVPGVPQA